MLTDRLVRATLPFSCPLRATSAGKAQQTPAQGETAETPDSSGADARSGNVQQTAAMHG
jgi:hypothetical protein